MAAYFALLEPGDTAMGLNLAQGGHLTHGLSANFSGKLYNFVPYGVDKETEQLDYDAVCQIARECRPKLIVTGATAYPRTIDFLRFREIADEVGALLMVDMAHIAGLVAAGVHPSPVPYADIVTSTTHKTLRGPRSAFILCKEEHAQKVDRAVFPGMQGGPLMHLVAAKAVAFHEAMQSEFIHYQQQVVENARILGEELQRGGVRIVSGGTDTHLVLADVSAKGISGRKAERALDVAGITVNKNTIPFDTRSPTVASGIRVGTPALTTRGFGPDEIRQTARWIVQVLDNPDSEEASESVRREVESLAEHYPVPGISTVAA
jgi:glycine hydroxymethyltransferase